MKKGLKCSNENSMVTIIYNICTTSDFVFSYYSVSGCMDQIIKSIVKKYIVKQDAKDKSLK
jgi:hypothetical protein